MTTQVNWEHQSQVAIRTKRKSVEETGEGTSEEQENAVGAAVIALFEVFRERPFPEGLESITITRS